MSQDPLHLLCVEPRFPGRLGAVADWLVRKRGYRCRFFCHAADPQVFWPESAGKGLDVIQFGVGGVAREAAVPWTRYLERGLCYAYGCWEVVHARRPQPIDVVLGRSAGLGSTLFTPVSLPRVPVVNLFDYFQYAHAHDLAEEAGPETPAEYFHWRRSANAMDLLDLENGVTPWVPTRWQRDLYPPEYRADFVVLYDGVDVRRFARRAGPDAVRTIAGRALPPGARVVTFGARSLDRVRGFDRFVELANRLLRARSDVVCVVAGEATVHRGLDVQFFNQDYKAHVLARTPPHDPQRFWFLGAVPQLVVAEVLAASDLHIYPARTYALARSLPEALAAGCVVLACDTEPVRELLTHGRTGLLFPPDDVEAATRQALAVLADPPAHRPLGAAAAALVRERYAQDVTLPGLADLFDRLVGTPSEAEKAFLP
jgi:glycosyltransferase involved in cell wall biosynthesis